MNVQVEIQAAVERLKKTGWLLVDELPINQSQAKKMLKSGKVISVVVGPRGSHGRGIRLVHDLSFNDYRRTLGTTAE